MRIGTMLSMPGDPCGTRELIARAVAAEQAGFSSCWLPQVNTIDALMVLALAGKATHKIELGTAVVPTYPRHPTVLAAQALTAQDASDNRLALGMPQSRLGRCAKVIDQVLIASIEGLELLPRTREIGTACPSSDDLALLAV